MTTYIATFFTHFAAISFERRLRSTDKKPLLMPVPRKLSSSCGTCVKFLIDSDITEFVKENLFSEDLDKVYIAENDNYTPVFENHQN